MTNAVRTCAFCKVMCSNLSCGPRADREEPPTSLAGFFLSSRACSLMCSRRMHGSNGGMTCSSSVQQTLAFQPAFHNEASEREARTFFLGFQKNILRILYIPGVCAEKLRPRARDVVPEEDESIQQRHGLPIDCPANISVFNPHPSYSVPL